MKHTRPPSRSAKAKKNAKLAMTLSLGTLVVTGFMRSKTARNIHILSGAALIGACAWHNSLYQPSNRKAKG
ncbi:MAG: hypothetical protein CSA21_05735 [Deltaproteobacteria bacterium]|nr:MAG: hypothetical protein CSA21_05735 [Deltaproteobacteria bacterium]